MLARLNYIMGDHCEAMAYQQKAVLMSEKVNGIDHPYTITEYVSNFRHISSVEYYHVYSLLLGSLGLVLFCELASYNSS